MKYAKHVNAIVEYGDQRLEKIRIHEHDSSR